MDDRPATDVQRAQVSRAGRAAIDPRRVEGGGQDAAREGGGLPFSVLRSYPEGATFSYRPAASASPPGVGLSACAPPGGSAHAPSATDR